MGKIHNILTYGARADGRTENTAQIQAAREYILARQRGRDRLFGGKRRDFLVVEGAGKGKGRGLTKESPRLDGASPERL